MKVKSYDACIQLYIMTTKSLYIYNIYDSGGPVYYLIFSESFAYTN